MKPCTKCGELTPEPRDILAVPTCAPCTNVGRVLISAKEIDSRVLEEIKNGRSIMPMFGGEPQPLGDIITMNTDLKAHSPVRLPAEVKKLIWNTDGGSQVILSNSPPVLAITVLFASLSDEDKKAVKAAISTPRKESKTVKSMKDSVKKVGKLARPETVAQRNARKAKT